MKTNGKLILYLVAIVAVFLIAQAPAQAQTTGKGNLTGFVYAKDKTTPVEGAVVKLKNVSSGVIYESNPTGTTGAFNMVGLDTGMYAFGVTSPKGDFDSEEVLGIAEGETAKLSVALNPRVDVDPKAEDAPSISGEKWVGKVISYDPETKTARVFMNNNLIKKDAEFHVKGDKDKYDSETDFWQKAKVIQENGLDVKKAIAERYYTILLEKPALPNDFLYIKKSTGLMLFLCPGGWAAVIAGSSIIIHEIVDPPDDASAFRK